MAAFTVSGRDVPCLSSMAVERGNIFSFHFMEIFKVRCIERKLPKR